MALLQKAYLGATPLFKNVDWFQPAAYNIVDNSNPGSPVQLVASSTAHTKGSWTELIASTSADASFLVVQMTNVGANATNTATLLDLATGASGSETAFASDIAIGSHTTAIGGGRVGGLFGFPIKIPSGTRISARIQSVVSSKTCNIIIFLIDAGDYATAPTSVDVIGADTATSQGTSFSGSSGTWVEATASTSQAYRAVTLVVSGHDAAMGNQTGIYEMGVGASGSEVGFGAARYQHTTVEFTSLMHPYTYMSGRNIPAGSRLAVKHPITADPSKYGFCLIGIP